MSQKRCPHCNVVINYADHIGNDFEHQCNSGNDVLDQEDVVVIGEHSTEFGATVETGRKPSEIMKQGIVNKFQGTLAGIDGARFGGITRRGANNQTHRQRQIYTMIDISGDRM